MRLVTTLAPPITNPVTTGTMSRGHHHRQLQQAIKAYLGGDGTIRKLTASINEEYSRNMCNFVPYGFVNITILLLMWLLAMWVGVHRVGRSEVDTDVLQRAANYATSGNTFIFAFAFSANVNKFIQSKAQWAEILSGIRDLGGYLNCLFRMAKLSGRSSTYQLVLDVLCGNIVLALGAKHTATRQRQKADILIPLSLHIGETPPESELSEEYCVILQRDTFENYLKLLDMLQQRSDGATEQLHRLVHRIVVAQQNMCANHVPTSVTLVLHLLIFATVMIVSAVEDTMYEAFVTSAAGVGIMVLPYVVSASTVTASYSCNVGWGGIFFVGADDRMIALLRTLGCLLNGSGGTDR